jgi:CheY-like chemotaxis protein
VNGTRSTSASGAAERLLFVHPVGTDRDLYASALREAGLDARVEATVASAATALEDGPAPGVILMELLPEPAAAWAFIERHARASVPVIFLTSLIRPDRANRSQAKALGCAAFVAKPCSVSQLVDIVLRVRRGGRGLEISNYSV